MIEEEVLNTFTEIVSHNGLFRDKFDAEYNKCEICKSELKILNDFKEYKDWINYCQMNRLSLTRGKEYGILSKYLLFDCIPHIFLWSTWLTIRYLLRGPRHYRADITARVVIKYQIKIFIKVFLIKILYLNIIKQY